MNPTDDQYSTALQQVTHQVNGALPFTGADVAIIAIVAVGMLLFGLMLQHRLNKTRQS